MQSSRKWTRRLGGLASSVVLLAFLLSGCDPKNADTPKPEVTSPKPPPEKVPAVPAPDSFEVSPPELLDAEVTMVNEQATDNARLALTFAPDKRLGESLQINVAERPVKFARESSDSFRYSAVISMDLKQLQDEISAQARAGERAPAIREFQGRQVLGEMSPQRLLPERASRLELNRPLKIHIDLSRLSAFLVDPNRELLVTSTSVVEDPSRTLDPCTGAGTAGGAWTFAKLMSDMANPGATGVAPAEFVESWLQTWATNASTATFPAAARPNIEPVVLANWPRTADGKLDLDKAPFRLLAIVNRLDLRTGSAYASGDAGEGRFVFGLVNRTASGSCASPSTLPFTVILEYKVPISGCTNVHDFAAQWRALGDIALGDSAFNPALQAITDQFTAAGAAPAAFNGSAIGQIRTNENALNPLWELREFKLAADHQLHTVSPAQAAQTSLNNMAVIDQYISANLALLATGKHTVPAQFPAGTNFQAGASANPFPFIAWRGPAAPATQIEERHQFSLATCNACHGSEVLDTTVPIADRFLHVRNRNPGSEAALSIFLRGDGTAAAPSVHAFPDPVASGTVRNMGDLARRQNDLASASGKCLSLGLINELRFKPLRMVH